MRDGAVTPGSVRFRPPWWAWLVTLILLAVMVRLGFWQLDRAEQKRDLQRDFATAAAAPPEALAVPAPPADDAPAHVRVRGHYLAAPQFLLDNQIREREPGLRVWTPLRRAGGGIILVDRGWIPDPGRDRRPDVGVDGRERTVSGLWRPFPQAGLAVGNALCDSEASPERVQYPAHDELRCRFDGRLASGLLLLDPQAPDGFLREWAPDHLEPEVHLGYAVQWFGFAAALLVIFVVVNWKRG